MKILLAVDGSNNSLRAAEFAACLAEYFPQSIIYVVYVDILFSFEYKVDFSAGEKMLGEPDENLKYVFDERVKDVFEKAKKMFSEKKLKYKIEVLERDNIAGAICDYAREKGIQNIIMGTRGLGSIKGIMIGSVSHKVIQLASCPVTLVK